MQLYTISINHHEIYFNNGTVLFAFDKAVACMPKGGTFCYVTSEQKRFSRFINKYCPKTTERIELTDEQFKLKLKEIVANG